MFDLSRLGAWGDLPFFAENLPQISTALTRDPRPILPPQHCVFAALEACPPEATCVVILGQDPYPTPGHAHGFAFSTAPDTQPLPKSLVNIFKEMEADLGASPPNGDLRFWAAQGVLLLNTALTTPAHAAGGHRGLGWATLTGQVLARLDQSPRAFVLWGKDAQRAALDLGHPEHLRLETAHPSPLSAHRGFFGSRPFSTVNRWLKERGAAPINWTTPP